MKKMRFVKENLNPQPFSYLPAERVGIVTDDVFLYVVDGRHHQFHRLPPYTSLSSIADPLIFTQTDERVNIFVEYILLSLIH